jgi:transposase-like protein
MPPRYTDEFKIDAIKQVLKNGYGVTEKMDIFLCLHFL